MNYKWSFAEAWQNAGPESGTGGPVDAIICPVSPAASIPHDFPVYWGYTSLWNMLDYPSVIVPVKDVTVDPAIDKKDMDYQPRENPFDKDNWAVCM